jgi:alkylation response protein AidB-like acyl-CoA dehydrogenase
VRTGDLLDSHGMTAFAVERGAKGFLSGKKENKLGMRASETAEVIFDNCRVHKDNIIGSVGEGFIQSMKILDGGRISIGAMALGIAEGALEASISYSKEREQFGKPISKFQGISFKLAEMATEIEASKMLLFKAASKMSSNSKDANYHSAIAKFKASEVAVSVANDAVQIFGGYGYSKEYPVEKFYRDSKLSTIGEGTSEIQKLVISRALLNN